MKIKVVMFKNYTPHVINIHTGSGIMTLEPAGPAPRLTVEREYVGHFMAIPMVRSKMGDPDGLPAPADGVYLIVSALVAEHPSLSNRGDPLYPGEAVRDDAGRVIGCKGLCVGPGWNKTMDI